MLGGTEDPEKANWAGFSGSINWLFSRAVKDTPLLEVMRSPSITLAILCQSERVYMNGYRSYCRQNPLVKRHRI